MPLPDKNRTPALNAYKTHVALVTIVAMLIGFFFSRALLSIGMMAFGLNALWNVPPKYWVRQRYWLFGVLWIVLYLFSFFWSHDIGYWGTRNEVKLPILLLPLAFAFLPAFSQVQLKIYTLALNALLLAGVVYTLYFLFSAPAFYIKGYDYSHVLPTLIKSNHIVYSTTLVVGVVWNLYYFRYVRQRWLKVLLLVSVLVFVTMVHVLAARTGLVSLYVFAFVLIVYLLMKRKNRKWGLLLLVSLLFTAFLSVSYVPTLHNRFNHFLYTIKMFKENNRTGDYSDIGRYISYELAFKLIRAHPLAGVGAGDLLDSMKGQYDRYYPQVPEEQRLIPHNQFLTVAVAAGVPALLLFTLWVFYPLTLLRRDRSSAYFFMIWCVLLVPLSVDPLLEIQFGVFVYLFFLLWQQHHMLREREATNQRRPADD